MQPAHNYKGPALCGGLFSATLFMSGEERWEKGEPAGNPPRSCNQGSLRSHMKDGLISGGLLLVGRSEEMVGGGGGGGGGYPIDLLWTVHVFYNSSTPTSTGGAIKSPRNVAVHNSICISNTG